MGKQLVNIKAPQTLKHKIYKYMNNISPNSNPKRETEIVSTYTAHFTASFDFSQTTGYLENNQHIISW